MTGSLEMDLAEYLREETVYLVYWSQGFWNGVLMTCLFFGTLFAIVFVANGVWRKLKKREVTKP
jgi:hypothetical protein